MRLHFVDSRLAAKATKAPGLNGVATDVDTSTFRGSGTMRVLVWHWGRVGRGPKFTFELARALERLPGTAVSVSASCGSDLDALCDAGGLDLDRVGTFSARKGSLKGGARAVTGVPALSRDFSASLASRRPDVALCAFQSVWDVAAIGALRRFAGRFVLVLHDASFHPGDYPMRARVLSREVAAADGLIVLSEHVGREATRIFGFPPDRIHCVPHGSYAFGGSRAGPRRHPGGRAVRLLFMGRVVEYKGLGLLVEAYRLLRVRGVSVTLEIAGEGDLSPHARALSGVADVAVENRWLDEIEMAGCLARADVLVLPYVEASQSGVAAAAMTAALPIVATPVGGLVEQVRHGATGLVAAAVDATSVADAIGRLVADADLYERCSRGAFRHAEEELGWTAVAAKVRAALEDLRGRPRRSAT